MKKVKFSALIVMMAVMLGAAPVHAQLVEMDLSDDPEPVSHESKELKLEESAPPESKVEEPAPTPPDKPEPQNWTVTDAVDRDTLEAEKSELDRIYKELEAERKIIAEKRAEFTKPVNRAALNMRTQIYNEKIEAYATRVDQFNKKVEAFNKNLTHKKKTDEFGRPVEFEALEEFDEPNGEKEEVP
ncbi:hypothetical protein LJC71_07395 [Desulfosarcina sp. OttesenSCG-928-A07]|nr:hypothetical protein [Desulfosarcina sp. OttesenSCG-928-A07]